MTEAIDWRGALDVLVPLGEECGGYVEEGDTKAAKGCVARFLMLDHAVLRLSHCPDMAPVYKSLQLLGMAPGQSMEMRKMATRIRTMRAERKAEGDSAEAPDLEAAEYDMPQGVVVPHGYRVDPSGVLDCSTEELIAHAPMLMTAVYRDYDTGKARVRLSWTHDGRWLHRVVSRQTAADARTLVALSEDFAPVNSTTASAAVRFLSAQEAASVLPVRKSTARQGWHGGTFLHGESGLGPDAVELQLTKEDEKGPALLAKALRPSGTLEQWQDMIAPMAERPVALLGLGATAAAPLLGVIPGARSFVLDVYASTSSGKTSAARTWASVWGDWGVTEVKWDGTKVGLERMGAFLRHLPFFVDDTKHAASTPQKVTDWIYDVSGARGKVRGTRNSFELGNKTDTIGIVTGERSATTMGDFAHGGAMARVLSITGEFTKDAETAKAMERDSRLYFGTAGREVITHLLEEQDRDGWASIRKEYTALEVKYTSDLLGVAEGEVRRVAHRAAPYLALIHMGLRLLHRADATRFDLATLRAAMDVAVAAAVRGVQKADIPREKMHRLINWAVSNRKRLYTPTSTERDPDPGNWGWAGRWDEAGLHFLPREAERVLKDECDWPNIYEAWKREGLIVNHATDGKERWTKNRRVAPGFGQLTPKCFTVSEEMMREALAAGTGEDQD